MRYLLSILYVICISSSLLVNDELSFALEHAAYTLAPIGTIGCVFAYSLNQRFADCEAPP